MNICDVTQCNDPTHFSTVSAFKFYLWNLGLQSLPSPVATPDSGITQLLLCLGSIDCSDIGWGMVSSPSGSSPSINDGVEQEMDVSQSTHGDSISEVDVGSTLCPPLPMIDQDSSRMTLHYSSQYKILENPTSLVQDTPRPRSGKRTSLSARRYRGSFTGPRHAGRTDHRFLGAFTC